MYIIVSNEASGMHDPHRQDGIHVAVLAIAAIAIVTTLWFIVGDFAHQQPNPGEFGDMFGAVNSLFTGLAFAGVIVTVWLQSRELKLQRLELAETRKELAGQKEQLSLQARTMKQQLEDENFFQLMRIFRGMATSMRHPGRDDLSGVTYWRGLAKEFMGHARLSSAGPNPLLVEQAWRDLYPGWEPSLGPYFATLAELLNFVADGSPESRPRWSRILRAQLAPQEMVPLFYHGLSTWGRTFLKGYIEEYHLFRYRPENLVGMALRQLYDASAFGETSEVADREST